MDTIDIPRNILSKFFLNQKYCIIDGGFSTECEAQGANISDELWSAKLIYENPDLIRTVHLNYYKAGADVCITSTYQATFEGFMKRGYTEEQSAEFI
jgi:homocysteine S-methyltransferase